MRPRHFLLALMLFTAPVPAAKLDFCFLNFAGITSAEAPQELILKTYADLLGELGASRQNDAFHRKWIESKDPFRVPDTENNGLDVLGS